MKKDIRLMLAFSVVFSASSYAQLVDESGGTPSNPKVDVNASLDVKSDSGTGSEGNLIVDGDTLLSVASRPFSTDTEDTEVTANYWGPIQLTPHSTRYVIRAEKSNGPGDKMTIPLGRFGSNGADNGTGLVSIRVSFSNGGWDNTGAAVFTLMKKYSTGTPSDLNYWPFVATRHEAYGAGARVKILGYSRAAYGHLILEYTSADPVIRDTFKSIEIQVEASGPYSPENRGFGSSSGLFLEVEKAHSWVQENSTTAVHIRPRKPSVQTLKADTIRLEGNVVLGNPVGGIPVGDFGW